MNDTQESVNDSAAYANDSEAPGNDSEESANDLVTSANYLSTDRTFKSAGRYLTRLYTLAVFTYVPLHLYESIFNLQQLSSGLVTFLLPLTDALRVLPSSRG